jgi:hypothetical protein
VLPKSTPSHNKDVVVEVCPMQEVVRYMRDNMGEEESAVPERVSSRKEQEVEVSRPALYPEELWSLVSPEDKVKVVAEFPRFPEPRLRQCIEGYGDRK